MTGRVSSPPPNAILTQHEILRCPPNAPKRRRSPPALYQGSSDIPYLCLEADGYDELPARQLYPRRKFVVLESQFKSCQSNRNVPLVSSFRPLNLVEDDEDDDDDQKVGQESQLSHQSSLQDRPSSEANDSSPNSQCRLF
ncbi:predicted protein [Phaeodactylum tricornutum CCAP 1055/1]|uniref:Uncharacterized protein n=1 Tax=Phaeodactylum tricornutum (strain CCAP 1055/1) TaxID=556484 RepID=B5Y3E6_PHATC|nr:predicted protein [Phaeodactylum tricornutum CCAP 1055/1]ACI65300.1 predicted protein [Phaeodactylum tricornutum CCAP 1055/1]|eukprot:XP_002185830.1 predicted protein [Phaeodactylum tricornutum CCAP 1055/1]